MTPQRQLRLDVAANCRLVTVETARAALGVDLQSVDAMIDEGALWAFNISPAGSRNRELRIWIRSLPGAGGEDAVTRLVTLLDVLNDIVGYDAEIRSGAVQALLSCDDNTVYRLFESGLIAGEMRRNGKARTLWVYSQSLHRFLRSRVLGAV